MIETLAPFFLHPGIAAAGAACAAVPIVIHLINRLRFRKVRFAAMEFLLQSEQRNRRRVLIEQLLLLLLRILLVLAAAALIARLALDPSTLSALRGGDAAHHVVILDDSGSMRATAEEGDVFEAAKRTLRDFAAEAARTPGSLQLTVLLLSRADADSALFARREVNTAFLSDLAEKLDALEPTRSRLRPAAGLAAAERRLASEEDVGERVVHLLSDFRTVDWGGGGPTEAVATDDAAGATAGDTAAAVERLDAAGVRVNLVRLAADAPENRRVADVSYGAATAAVGVPLRVRVEVSNESQTAAETLELSAALDGQPLPLGESIPALEPGETAVREFDVQFDDPGRHAVSVSVPSDGLPEDDSFTRPVLVLPRVPVLVVDGAADLDAANRISLLFDPELTGREVRIGGTDLLRKEDLSQFWTIYVVNVPRLPADAVGPLTRYVENGGGLIWFGGEIDAEYYTDTLVPAGLFPVPLAGPSVDLPAEEGAGPDVRFAEHPVTQALTLGENLFADLVKVYRYLPVPDDWERDDAARNDGVETVATLRNGAPLVLASRLGEGRILTVLTTAGVAPSDGEAEWTNWPRTPPFPLFHLPAQEWAARIDTGDAVGASGEPLEFVLDAARFRPDVLIERPDDLSASLTATPRLREDEPGVDGAPVTDDELLLTARYADTDLPGVYKARLTTAEGEPVDRWTALNFPAAESRLALIAPAALTDALSGTRNVTVQEAGDAAWTGGGDQSREMRWWLLGLMAALMAAESLLAYRCGYHGAGA
ncbi:BatA domain-containing protein [Alienimonas sp. DA493]|uniref:BatA domain-containing protein n=1 Tax=Alienimonas sp. DA493 TaxID=3373605 RepID=UPI003754C00C